MLSTVMFMGYGTELISRPSKDGLSWLGDEQLGRWLNYCYRMQLHVLAFIPYITVWVIFIRNFQLVSQRLLTRLHRLSHTRGSF